MDGDRYNGLARVKTARRQRADAGQGQAMQARDQNRPVLRREERVSESDASLHLRDRN